MAEQSKMSLPNTYFVFSLQLFDFSTDQKNKIHFGLFIWSSIHFHLFANNDFQNGATIQYGVFKIFFYFTSFAGVFNYAAFKLSFQNMIYIR
jgi:hypothetical protein